MGAQPLQFSEVASESWQIAAPESVLENPTFVLPGQFDRVQKISEFSASAEYEQASLLGRQTLRHAATTAYLLRDAILIDGVLYAGSVARHLHRRTRNHLFANVSEVSERHALYCTYGGNTYFGTWLMDDCVTLPLAKSCGIAARTKWPTLSNHMAEYAHILEAESAQCDNILFKELVVFDDLGQNRNKQLRAKAMSAKLVAHLDVESHAGVYLVRGSSGATRLLENEQEVALHVQKKYGLRAIDPTKLSVMDIVSACAGARMVIGVEGSHLLHGILHLLPGGSLLALQPPNRYCTLLKGLTERDGQKFGLVVGKAGLQGDTFRIDLDELDRTIALMLDA